MASYGYVEISGSNRLTISKSNVAQATRVFIGPWANRFLFAGAISEAPHPESEWLVPQQVTIEPFLGDATNSLPPSDPVTQAIAYDHCRITVEYGVDAGAIAWWPPGMSVPHRREGTYLELRAESGGEFLKTDNAVWEDNPDGDPEGGRPEGDSPAFRLFIPEIQFEIIWHYVDEVPVSRLDGLVGSVNQYSFLGKPPETMLFTHYSFQTETVLDLDNPVRWAVSCQFIYRGVKGLAEETYGWNHELGPTGWKRVQVIGQLGVPEDRYPKADFSGMFL